MNENSAPALAAGVRPLTAEKLRRRCDAGQFEFGTTEDLEIIDGLVGQERALDALTFGAEMRGPGFNVFVLGVPGSGKHNAVKEFLREKADKAPSPDDWVYVHNFAEPHRPIALRLPPGRSARLHDGMHALIDGLRTAFPAVFESDDYQSRRKEIDAAFQQQQQEAFAQLAEDAEKQGVAILRTKAGIAMAPISDGKAISPEEFKALPKREQTALRKKMQRLQAALQEIMESVPRLDKERREQIRELDRRLATLAVRRAMNDLVAEFADLPKVETYLEQVRQDLVENAQLFLSAPLTSAGQLPAEAAEEPIAPTRAHSHDARFGRYEVNVMVRHSLEGEDAGAPVITDDHPALGNLLGRVEHMSQMGALVTNFTLIKPGSLHRANGGYLLIDAVKILREPFAWEALKRALRNSCITIESPGAFIGVASTVTLEPDPIELDVKVVLFGDRHLFHLLSARDPDFHELFKVAADFEEIIVWDEDNAALLVRLLGGICRRESLRPLDPGGAARIVEHAARLAGDSERLSVRIGPLADVLREADYWAGKGERKAIGNGDVERAVDERIRRLDRARQRSHEAILRETLLIETDGAVIGQINGLSVHVMGGLSFGRPCRITARVRMGGGRVLDIERESKLGGNVHSKGVMILSGFLSSRYALDTPAAMAATLVFEQSYGGVDGDSASSTELYALLSALADVPVKQSLAITGSVNQFGDVQAIGGVNQKIEGFYDICEARGLTGQQGVLIPTSNVKHLMLREDVAEACREGRFHVYAVSHIDEGIELLTGREAGIRGADGLFPDGTINRLVEDRLIEFAESRRLFNKRGRGTNGNNNGNKGNSNDTKNNGGSDGNNGNGPNGDNGPEGDSSDDKPAKDGGSE